MNDNEWNDYLTGNTLSPYSRVQDSIRVQNALSNPSTSVGRPYSGGSSEPDIIAEYFEWVRDKAGWLAETVPPFKQLMKLSAWLQKSAWKVRAIFGVIGIVVATRYTIGPFDPGTFAAGFGHWLERTLGDHRMWMAPLAGFLAGAFSLPLIGGLLEGIIRIGFGLILFSLTLFAIWCLYALAALFFDWPIPFV
jgi:hypothetical protein